ncbi:uncharacterized protein LOC121389921 [Gigantopelta aegis]|uniref:uncharacterized protein LOC121389921 n=1 Tax=Gigantopelta aegis TaxID=1735272 RepID=UPI001B88AC7C|nr:uncharacterized protein LOC121389921 [Gigantopelta aegis]
MWTSGEYARLITTLTIILVLTEYSLQATLQVTAKPNNNRPFGNECVKHDDCSCMNGGVPLCYSGYCHCVYSIGVVCKTNLCGQHCPSGVGICFLEKCHCYRLVEDRDATDAINIKPELIDPKEDNGVPTLLK